jgi:hypothetical protein
MAPDPTQVTSSHASRSPGGEVVFPLRLPSLCSPFSLLCNSHLLLIISSQLYSIPIFMSLNLSSELLMGATHDFFFLGLHSKQLSLPASLPAVLVLSPISPSPDDNPPAPQGNRKMGERRLGLKEGLGTGRRGNH